MAIKQDRKLHSEGLRNLVGVDICFGVRIKIELAVYHGFRDPGRLAEKRAAIRRSAVGTVKR